MYTSRFGGEDEDELEQALRANENSNELFHTISNPTLRTMKPKYKSTLRTRL